MKYIKSSPISHLHVRNASIHGLGWSSL